MDISTRLAEAFKAKGMNLKEVAATSGTNYRTLMRYMSGEREPGAGFLASISDRMGISPTWILTGSPPMWTGDEGPNGHSAPGLAEASVEFATPEQLADFVSVPALDSETSPGSVGHYAFSRAWLTQQKLDPDALAVVLVTGDSMEPRLSDGDLAVINTADTNLRDGVTYAVRLGAEVITKRLQVLPLQHVKLCAINSEFEPIVVDLSAGELKLLGRVVASMHEW